MNITANDLASADRKLFEVYLLRDGEKDRRFDYMTLAVSEQEIRQRLPHAPPNTFWVVLQCPVCELDEVLHDIAHRRP